MYMMAFNTENLAKPDRFKVFLGRLYFGLCSPESRLDTEGLHAIVLLVRNKK